MRLMEGFTAGVTIVYTVCIYEYIYIFIYIYIHNLIFCTHIM
jgi:hypothetical protein